MHKPMQLWQPNECENETINTTSQWQTAVPLDTYVITSAMCGLRMLIVNADGEGPGYSPG